MELIVPEKKLPSSEKMSVFYDDTCEFCRRKVVNLQKKDAKKRVAFFPLTSKEAKISLGSRHHSYLAMNTIVCIFNKKIYIRMKGVLRIYWQIGGKWKILGAFSFLPFFLIDWLYILFAKHRK